MKYAAPPPSPSTAIWSCPKDSLRLRSSVAPEGDRHGAFPPVLNGEHLAHRACDGVGPEVTAVAVDVLRDELIRVYRADSPIEPAIYRRNEIAEAEPAEVVGAAHGEGRELVAEGHGGDVGVRKSMSRITSTCGLISCSVSRRVGATTF